MKFIGAASKISFYYKKNLEKFPDWNLIYKLKCLTTESELDKYLQKFGLKNNIPVAIIAKEQKAGIGQYGRKWISPAGGIWLSAAYPILSKDFNSQIFPMSMAFKLCEMLIDESIDVKIKWPNDIFYGSKILIGFLPKVVTRGNRILYLRIGVGMNLNNYVPMEGISVSKILNKKNLCEYYWTAKILNVICQSIKFNQKKNYIIKGVNRYLNKKYLPNGYKNKECLIQYVDSNGDLILIKDNHQIRLKNKILV